MNSRRIQKQAVFYKPFIRRKYVHLKKGFIGESQLRYVGERNL